MKKGVLRVLAGFLAVMLAFSSGSTAVYAEEISAEISAGEDSPAEEEEIGQEDTEPEQAAEEKVTIQGSVEVQVISGIGTPTLSSAAFIAASAVILFPSYIAFKNSLYFSVSPT